MQERKMRHSLVKQGYLMERTRTASMITEEDENLPLFDEIMGLTLRRRTKKRKAREKGGRGSSLTANLIPKASYVMRRIGKF